MYDQQHSQQADMVVVVLVVGAVEAAATATTTSSVAATTAGNHHDYHLPPESYVGTNMPARRSQIVTATTPSPASFFNSLTKAVSSPSLISCSCPTSMLWRILSAALTRAWSIALTGAVQGVRAFRVLEMPCHSTILNSISYFCF